MATTPVFLPWKSHGERMLVGFSPWGHTESDTTEPTYIHTHTHTHNLVSAAMIIWEVGAMRG